MKGWYEVNSYGKEIMMRELFVAAKEAIGHILATGRLPEMSRGFQMLVASIERIEGKKAK